MIEDNVHVGFDVSYTNDDISRLTQAESGTWGGASISSRTRQEDWTLQQVGNWDIYKLDLNGDNDWSDTDEYQAQGTFNNANEQTDRDLDTDNDGMYDDANYALTYDAVGNLTDDGEDYEYEYDPFGRLVTIKKTSNQATVAEFEYNGLGYRKSYRHDTDGDESMADETWFHLAYDERWRIIGMYEDTDTSPTEVFVHHAAGLDGRGGSSYIDSVLLRDRDTTGDTTLDERVYYCQNWRADVEALIDDSANQVEQVRYTAYGRPFNLPAGDCDSDGDVDVPGDGVIQSNWINAPSYDVRGDMDLDGDLDSNDQNALVANLGSVGQLDTLSQVSNERGYAGYQHDEMIQVKIHAKYSAIDLQIGIKQWRDDDRNRDLYQDRKPNSSNSNPIAGPATNSEGIPIGPPADCKNPQIKVYCRPIDLTLDRAEHCFIHLICDDKPYACRGGPNNGGTTRIPCPGGEPRDALRTRCQYWDRRHPDNTSDALDPPSEDITDRTGDPEQLFDCIKDSMKRIDCCVSYNPLGPNSNTAISTTLRRCGIEMFPAPADRPAPGWDDNIDVDSDCVAKRQKHSSSCISQWDILSRGFAARNIRRNRN